MAIVARASIIPTPFPLPTSRSLQVFCHDFEKQIIIKESQPTQTLPGSCEPVFGDVDIGRLGVAERIGGTGRSGADLHHAWVQSICFSKVEGIEAFRTARIVKSWRSKTP